MTAKTSRLIDHIHLRVADLEASKRFYRAALEALGLLEGYGDSDQHSVLASKEDELSRSAAPSSPRSRTEATLAVARLS